MTVTSTSLTRRGRLSKNGVICYVVIWETLWGIVNQKMTVKHACREVVSYCYSNGLVYGVTTMVLKWRINTAPSSRHPEPGSSVCCRFLPVFRWDAHRTGDDQDVSWSTRWPQLHRVPPDDGSEPIRWVCGKSCTTRIVIRYTRSGMFLHSWICVCYPAWGLPSACARFLPTIILKLWNVKYFWVKTQIKSIN